MKKTKLNLADMTELDTRLFNLYLYNKEKLTIVKKHLKQSEQRAFVLNGNGTMKIKTIGGEKGISVLKDLERLKDSPLWPKIRKALRVDFNLDISDYDNTQLTSEQVSTLASIIATKTKDTLTNNR